ncbi:thioredoxin family protein [Bacillus xiapuensis]|uniref:thioredoxin family protein n=1 Tax=Bacillus xiapuensis TaxID=2014075 RepID=UPI0018E21442|nr:thioredoxin family protein [Bacillus xiapuensis]
MSTEKLLKAIQQKDKTAIYAYAPMCGTCQIAGKMLDVVEQIVKNYSWFRIDLNYHEDFAERYSIESVPCLLIFKEGQLREKIYAFQSVPHIYEKLTNDGS